MVLSITGHYRTAFVVFEYRAQDLSICPRVGVFFNVDSKPEKSSGDYGGWASRYCLFGNHYIHAVGRFLDVIAIHTANLTGSTAAVVFLLRFFFEQ